MDRVFFELKRGHIETVKFGRRVLSGFGLTPARFDVLYAITTTARMTQSQVRRALGVARATLSEMLGVLEQLGLVARTQANEDRRTRIVSLTKKGSAMLSRAADAILHNGFMPLLVDAALSRRDLERYDSDGERQSLTRAIFHLLDDFGLDTPRSLYELDLELLQGVVIATHDPLGEFDPVGSHDQC
jgi:DNA-binding MarR family transcriptional regulator